MRPGRQPLEEAIELVKRFKARGLDLIDVSVGSNTPESRPPHEPAFLVPVAARIKREAEVPRGVLVVDHRAGAGRCVRPQRTIRCGYPRPGDAR